MKKILLISFLFISCAYVKPNKDRIYTANKARVQILLRKDGTCLIPKANFFTFETVQCNYEIKNDLIVFKMIDGSGTFANFKNNQIIFNDLTFSESAKF